MMRRRLLGAAASVVMLAAALTGCLALPVPAPSITPPDGIDDADVAYATVDGEELTANICLPRSSGEAAPAIVLVHGGAFESGDKDTMTETCAMVAEWGYVAVAVDYRLVPAHTFPAQVDDVRTSVEWLRESPQAERWGIDPSRIGLLGSSAGAIIALSSAAGLSEAGQPVSFVVGLSAAGDLTESGEELGTASPLLEPAVLAYLGCADIEDCPVAAQASPLFSVEWLPPTLLVHSEDDFIPLPQAESLSAAIEGAGIATELIVVPGERHGLQLLSSDIRTSIEDFAADAF